jgi:hypothetical protein
MATDPKQLPPNVTPEQAQILQQTQVQLASAKFDKVREANNKSAKRGRYKRMATTVVLADEIMRQKAEIKRLGVEKDTLNHKLERVESVMPGLTNATEVAHGSQLTDFNQHGHHATNTTSSFFDKASQSFKSSGSPEYESSHSNALGITLPTMSDLFGSPIQQPQPSETAQSNAFGLTLPSTSDMCTGPSEQPVEDTHQDNSEDNSDTSDLSLSRQSLREAHEMRLQLIDAVKGGKLHELGFGCHEEIDAIIQRGRRIRESLDMPDDDWDRWTPPAANVTRRKRCADAGEEEETRPPAKKARKSKA